MTLSRLSLRFSLLAVGLLGPVSPLPAQNFPRPVVSSRSDEATKAPIKGTSAFVLRPNAELSFYVYLENPGEQVWDNVTVRLTEDEQGRRPLAEGLVERIGAGEVVKVALRPAGQQPPPPAAPVAAPPPGDEKEKAPPAAAKPPAGAPTPDVVYLHALDDKKQPFPGARPTAFDVRISPPRGYLEATPLVTPTETGYNLTIRLGRRKDASEAFRGKPATARLDINPDLVPGLDPASLKDGTFQTVVAPNARNVTLVAKNLRFIGPPGPSTVTVSVDGYDRAFVFATDFSGTTPSLTSPEVRRVRIDTPRYGVPGRPLDVRLEVFNDEESDRPRLEFYRAEDGEPEVPTASLTTPRQRTVRYRVGDAGELVFHAEVKDWVIPLDTEGVFGTRTLRFALTDAEGGVLTRPRADDPDQRVPIEDVKLITLDATPPENTRLLALPPKVVPKKPRKLPPPPGAVPTPPGPVPVPGVVLPPWACGCILPPAFGVPAVPVPPVPLVEKPREPALLLPLPLGKTRIRGTTLELIGRAEDPESGVAAVLFFLGAPPGPDGKPPPGGKVVVGELVFRPQSEKEEGPPEAIGFGATFDLPDVVGPVVVGVRFINGAGLAAPDVTVELLLVDPPPPPLTGAIEGRVIQGSTPERPQPGLDVLLLSPAGQVVKTTQTDAAGLFRFDELLPGPYVVFTAKPADLGARGTLPATVEAGEVTAVTVELRR
jgi:hypothetical protein